MIELNDAVFGQTEREL